jgi:streptogramin lyase
MNGRILRTLLLIIMSAVCVGPAYATPIVSILPSNQVIEAPGSFTVTVGINGLQSDDPAPLLGAFSLDLVFDPALVSYLPSQAAVWGSGLGDLTAGGALVGVDFSTPGILHLSEVSLLEADPDTCLLCSGPYLRNLQGATFNLVTLHFFYAATTGSTQLTISNPLFSDADGNPITLGAANGATVRVPEPGTWSMLALGIGVMMWLRRRKAGPWCGLWLLLSLNGVANAQNTAIQAGELFVTDARVPAVLRLDPASGRKVTVTSGDKLKRPFGAAIAADGDLYITDNSAGLIRVNPITGVQRFIIECPAYACNAPIRVAVAANGQLIGVGGSFSPGGDRVVQVDPVTGAMTNLSSGGLLARPIDLGIAANGDVYVLDNISIIRLRYDAATQRWVQSLVSTGGRFRAPAGIAVADNGALYVADLAGQVLRIDPVSGAQTPIVSAAALVNHGNLAVAPNGDIFVVGDSFQYASLIRLRFNTATGIWTLKTITAPGQLQEPSAIAVARDPVSRVALEAAKDAYIRKDLAVRQNDNYGRQEFMTVGTGREPFGEPDAMRGIVAFDLAKVPLAQFQQAKLRLTIHSFDNGAASSTYRLEAHRVTDGPLAIWNEGNGFEGSGGPPASADPDSAYGIAWSGAGDNPDPFALNNETQPGFDRLIVASKTVNQGNAHAGDSIDLDVTSLVAAWLGGSASNFGIMLTDTTSDGLFRGIRLGAREGKLFGIAGAVAGPRLVIRYKDGDINDDGSVDSKDVQAVMAALNLLAGPQDPRDIDGDGKITVLDARKVSLLCSRPNCAPPPAGRRRD